MLKLRRAAAALCCVLSLAFHVLPGARAETPNDEIAEASRLVEAGQLEQAQAIVSRLRAAPHPDLQVLFLSGALHFLNHRYSEAAEEFRLMLARDPTLIRARLELARALYFAGDYQAARYHFEQALAANPPDMVRANVLAYLTQIRERLPSFALSFDVLSDSNPKRATSSSVVEIGGRLYQLNQAAQAEHAIGGLVIGQAKVPLKWDPSWFVRGYVENYDYTGGDLDSTYIQAMGGKHVNLGLHGIDIEAGTHVYRYAGKRLYDGATWRVSDFFRPVPTLGVNLAVDARQLHYEDFPFLSGWQYVVAGEGRYALSPASNVSAGLSYIRGDAAERAYSFEGGAVSARYVREWKGGWIASLYYQYAQYRFDGVDPFFGITRSDRENRIEVGLTNRYLVYKGFVPRLTIGSDERRSNIELYTFSRTYVRVGVVTEF